MIIHIQIPPSLEEKKILLGLFFLKLSMYFPFYGFTTQI